MYKILIKKPNLPKGAYVFYTETVTDVNEETDTVTKTTVIYEASDLNDLSEKYKELLKTYTTDEIIAVDELGIELIANITDTTG